MSAGKAFAALGVGAIGSVGTYFIVNSSSSSDVMPDKYVLLSASATEAYNDKLGNDYKHFLISADKDSKENQEWWEWAFKKWKGDKDDIKGAEFAKDQVTSAFSTGNSADNKALNRVCKTVYNKAKTEIEGTTDDAKIKRRKGLWKYCSPLGEVPKTVQEGGDGHANNTIGKAKENILLSAKDKNNEMAWEMMNREFFKEEATFDSGHNFFKKFHGENKDQGEGRKKLKDGCITAYGTSTSSTAGDTIPSQTETIKYCTLKGSE